MNLIDDALLDYLDIDKRKLEANLNRIPEEDKIYLQPLLSLIREKKQIENLPHKQDLRKRLEVTFSKINGIVGLYKAANIIAERKIVRVYQYDVHKDIKMNEGGR